MSTDQRQTHRRSDLAVMDAEEYKQKDRLKSILESQKAVEERSDDAWQSYARGEITEDAKNIWILRAVKSFLREIRNLLLEYRHQRKDAGDPDIYLVMDEEDRRAVAEPLGEIKMDHDDPKVFWGLYDVLHAEEFYPEKWVETTPTRNGPDRERERSRSHSVPESVSWGAFLLGKEFLAEEKGVEIQFETIEQDVDAEVF